MIKELFDLASTLYYEFSLEEDEDRARARELFDELFTKADEPLREIEDSTYYAMRYENGLLVIEESWTAPKMFLLFNANTLSVYHCDFVEFFGGVLYSKMES